MLISRANVTLIDAEIRVEWDSWMSLGSHLPGANRCSLLKFDLERRIRRPVTVHQAELLVAVSGPPGAAGEVAIGTVLTRWDGTSVSWDWPWSQPGMSEGADYERPRIVPVVTPNDGELVHVKIDVLDDVSRWMSGRLSNFGWRISASVAYGGAKNPHEAAAPALLIKYSEGAPAASGSGIAQGVF